jgi:hypothetical protein
MASGCIPLVDLLHLLMAAAQAMRIMRRKALAAHHCQAM